MLGMAEGKGQERPFPKPLGYFLSVGLIEYNSIKVTKLNVICTGALLNRI